MITAPWYYASEYAIACAAAVAEEAGAVIHRDARVDRILPDEKGVMIVAGDRSFRVGRVVVTTGGWASELLPEVNDVLIPKRTWQSWYFAEDPEQFLPERFPPFGRTFDGVRFRGAPTIDRRFVCIGAVEELPERIVDNDPTGPRVLPDMSIVKEYVQEYFNGLRSDPVRGNARPRRLYGGRQPDHWGSWRISTCRRALRLLRAWLQARTGYGTDCRGSVSDRRFRATHRRTETRTLRRLFAALLDIALRKQRDSHHFALLPLPPFGPARA